MRLFNCDEKKGRVVFREKFMKAIIMRKTQMIMVFFCSSLSMLAFAADDFNEMSVGAVHAPLVDRVPADTSSKLSEKGMSVDEKMGFLMVVAHTLMSSHVNFGEVIANIEMVDEEQASVFEIGVEITKQYPAEGNIKVGKNIIESIDSVKDLHGLAALCLTKLMAKRVGVISSIEQYQDEESRHIDYESLARLTYLRLDPAFPYPLKREDFISLLNQHNHSDIARSIVATKEIAGKARELNKPALGFDRNNINSSEAASWSLNTFDKNRGADGKSFISDVDWRPQVEHALKSARDIVGSAQIHTVMLALADVVPEVAKKMGELNILTNKFNRENPKALEEIRALLAKEVGEDTKSVEDEGLAVNQRENAYRFSGSKPFIPVSIHAPSIDLERILSSMLEAEFSYFPSLALEQIAPGSFPVLQNNESSMNDPQSAQTLITSISTNIPSYKASSDMDFDMSEFGSIDLEEFRVMSNDIRESTIHDLQSAQNLTAAISIHDQLTLAEEGCHA